MIELNKFIKKWILDRTITSIWDKYWYPYTVERIIRENEIEYRWKHLFVMWKAKQKYDFCIDFVKTKLKISMKNNFFYTTLK